MITQKAVIAQVQIGDKIIEGLMLPDGSYRISIPQIATLVNIQLNYATQTLKRLLGNEFSPHKISISNIKQKINTVSLTEFMLILNKLAFNGNKESQAFLLALAEESIERRFNNAFGQKCTEDEYNEKLKLRIKRLMARKDYTDVLMNRHVDLYGVKPEPCDYKNWTVMVNTKLFGVKHFKCDRDNMTSEQQELILDFERMAKRFSAKDANFTPLELIAKSLDTFPNL